jgi:hypothetical protein
MRGSRTPQEQELLRRHDIRSAHKVIRHRDRLAKLALGLLVPNRHLQPPQASPWQASSAHPICLFLPIAIATNISPNAPTTCMTSSNFHAVTCPVHVPSHLAISNSTLLC